MNDDLFKQPIGTSTTNGADRSDDNATTQLPHSQSLEKNTVIDKTSAVASTVTKSGTLRPSSDVISTTSNAIIKAGNTKDICSGDNNGGTTGPCFTDQLVNSVKNHIVTNPEVPHAVTTTAAAAVPSTEEKASKTRMHIAKEIRSTEKTFQKQLSIPIKFYSENLVDKTPKQIKDMMTNAGIPEEIYSLENALKVKEAATEFANSGKELLDNFETAWSGVLNPEEDDSKLQDKCVEALTSPAGEMGISSMEKFSPIVQKHSTSGIMKILQQLQEAHGKKTDDKEIADAGKNHPIVVIQRAPRYVLLMKEMNKNRIGANDDFKKNLDSSVAKAEECALRADSAIKKYQTKVKAEKIDNINKCTVDLMECTGGAEGKISDRLVALKEYGNLVSPNLMTFVKKEKSTPEQIADLLATSEDLKTKMKSKETKITTKNFSKYRMIKINLNLQDVTIDKYTWEASILEITPAKMKDIKNKIIELKKNRGKTGVERAQNLKRLLILEDIVKTATELKEGKRLGKGIVKRTI
jgi:hypothetical protein